MATVTLSSGFDTENLWAPRLAGAITTNSTTYEFQSAFGFVRVTGTGFTYVGSAITGGDSTSILVATDVFFSTPIATYSGSSHDAGFFFLMALRTRFPMPTRSMGRAGLTQSRATVVATRSTVRGAAIPM